MNNKTLQSWILSQAINDYEDFAFEKRKLVLNKCRSDHFLSKEHRELFLFLQQEWLEDEAQSIEQLMPKIIQKGMLDFFLDVINEPQSGTPIEVNINYLFKDFLEYQYQDAFAQGDRQKLSELDQQFKKLNSQLITEKSFYEDETIKEEINDAIMNGLDLHILNTYIRGLKDYFNIIKKQTTVVTGIPASGKSNFVDAIAVNMAAYHNWKIVYFSPENQPIKLHLMNIARKYKQEPMLATKKNFDATWILEHFKFINTNEIEHDLDLILESAYKEKPDLFVIDPWNEINVTKEPETQFISESLSKIKSFSYRANCHIMIVAHPTKLRLAEKGDYAGQFPPPTAYDISGSAMWYNKPDNILSLWRDRDSAKIEVHIQKIKFENVTGNRGMHRLNYKVETGEYL